MNEIPDHVEILLAELTESIQTNATTLKQYNARCVSLRNEQNHFSRTSLDEIRGLEGQIAHLDREFERNGLPKLNDGVDDKGRQKFKTDDPRPALLEKIKWLKRERNKRMSERTPGEVDFVSWLKTQRGKRLTPAS
jgi:hypothetical protein